MIEKLLASYVMNARDKLDVKEMDADEKALILISSYRVENSKVERK